VTGKGASVTVTFNGTYLQWIATRGTTLQKALVSLDGGPTETIELHASQVAYQQNVWNTGPLSKGEHTVKISWDATNDPGSYISVDAFETDGTLVTLAPKPKLNRYEQNDSRLFYYGTWTATSAAGASGGSHRYTTSGSVTVRFDGTYLAWLGKKSPVYGKAKVYVDGVYKTTVSLYSTQTTYGKVWDTGTLSSGRHSVTIAWVKNSSSTTAINVSVDAFDILGTLVPARFQEGTAEFDYSGSWKPFSTSYASGGRYLRSSESGASVTITFVGSYLAWIATKGTTLTKAQVSVDGGAPKTIDLARTSVAYQQKVWTTGVLTWGTHTVIIKRAPNATLGKYISLDAIDVAGVVK
jgi:hypothetical protein